MTKGIVILGGPNGAGKTTAAKVLLPEIGISEFVNADEIARGLSLFNPSEAAVTAGRLMLSRIGDLITKRESFAFETTCSGRAYGPLLNRCQQEGWSITLLFLWLPSPEMALARVARRVNEGGHSIPAEIVRRRYRNGLINMLELYLPLAEQASIYDNSDEGRVLIAERTRGSSLAVHDEGRWDAIRQAAR